jgi:uncharacterized protein YecE (DUF72 family)
MPILDRLPTGYEYAVEFRHPSWQTEGALELLKQQSIASVLTDSLDPGLQFLSNPVVTADHSFIRLHGRNHGYWYNYLYSKKELEPRTDKVNEIANQTKKLWIYFNNHYAGAAIINAMQFEEMLGQELLCQVLANQKVPTLSMLNLGQRIYFCTHKNLFFCNAAPSFPS